MKGIIGRKLGMTQIFNDKGLFVPVTVIQAGPCVVANLKTKAVDGYDAVVLAYEDIKEQRQNKAETGLYKKSKLKPMKYLKEFTFTEAKAVGDVVNVTIFAKGEMVDVSGTTKGRGFTGVIKRWNMARLKESHGTGPVVRQGGSTGANSTPSRVLKGKKMAGQYGNEASTMSNLEVVGIDEAKNCILVKGAVPGAKGSLVTVRNAAKAAK